MADPIQLEWLNQNSLRNYPIRENAQRRPYFSDGVMMEEYALPNYLVTDFIMTVGSDVSVDLYIMKLAVVGDAVTIVIGSGDSVAASVYIDASKHKTNTGYTFTGINDYSDARGNIVIGDLARFRDERPDGVYNFYASETPFEFRCVRPSVKRVSSISIYDPVNNYQSKKLTGHVRLVAGSSITFKYDEELNGVIVSAEKSDGYNEKCDCGTDTTVKTINGISTENVTIMGDDCVSVTTTGHTIKISDTCSKPCCGCAELDFINEKISQINTAINKIEAYSDMLGTRIEEMQASYVEADNGGSKT